MFQGVVSTSLKTGYVLKSGVFGGRTALFHKIVCSRKEWEADSFRSMGNASALAVQYSSEILTWIFGSGP